MLQTVKAQLKYLRITPRKTRLVADIIRGLGVDEAEAQLMFLPNRAGVPILKLLRSAIANARTNAKLGAEALYVKEIRVDSGPKLKRFMPRARGSAYRIEKKMSHVTIVLGEQLPELRQSRFLIVRPTRKEREKAKKQTVKRVKHKSEKEIPSEKASEVSKGDGSHEEQIGRTENTRKRAKEPGVFKRVFRRKAV